MKKILVLMVVVFLLSGCNMYQQRTIVLNCIDGKVYIDIYAKGVSNKSENIKYPENIEYKNVLYVDDNNQPMKCIK